MVGTPAWTDEELESLRASPSYREFVDRTGSGRSWHAYRHKRRELGLDPARRTSPMVPHPTDPRITWDKQDAEDLDLEEVVALVERIRGIKAASSGRQNFARIRIDTDRPFPIMTLSDTHLGAISTDHRLLLEFTEALLSTECRVILCGDLTNMAIRHRGVDEMQDDVLDAELQVLLLKKFIEKLGDRVLVSTWGNHDTQRQEEFAGYSDISRLLAERTIQTDGIAHVDVTVGDVEYRCAVSHRFRGGGSGPAAGCIRHIALNPSRDIAIQGDTHQPAIVAYTVEGRDKLAVNTGTVQTASGYAKRHFTLHTATRFPVVILDPEQYAPRAYYDLSDYLKAEGG